MPISGSVQKKFSDALDDLLAQVKQDRSILAAILCGSLSHDTVWAKSDIDLALVTIDDKKAETASLSLYADGVNVHAFLMSRGEFRKTVEGTVRHSFIHSLLAKGRLLYTHDETIADLCAKLGEIGARDTRVQLLVAATNALGPIDKARKWFVTRGDLNYAALWILYAANSLARVEVISRGRLADREVIPQAIELNPEFFQVVYAGLLNTEKTRRRVQAALDAIDNYLADRATMLFGPILDHLRDVNEARSATEIESYFLRNFSVERITPACEYLSDLGLIGKVSAPVQLTRKSNIQVQELAFVHFGEPPDAF